MSARDKIAGGTITSLECTVYLGLGRLELLSWNVITVMIVIVMVLLLTAVGVAVARGVFIILVYCCCCGSCCEPDRDETI